MRRSALARLCPLPLLALSGGLGPAAVAAEPALLTVSASAVDPFLNTGLPAGGPRVLFVWYACGDAPLRSAHFRLEGTFLEGTGYSLRTSGPSVADASGNLTVIPDCIAPPAVLARLVYPEPPGGGTVCLEATVTGGSDRPLVLVCGQPLPRTAATIGFSSDGTLPCEEGSCGEALAAGGTDPPLAGEL